MALVWRPEDEQADSGSNSDEENSRREVVRLEDLARQSCASALAKCAPVKNVKPDVCILVIDSSVKRRRGAENASYDPLSTQFHVLRPILMEFSEYFRKCFEHDLCERRHSFVHISEFDEEVTTAFVEFLYTGQVSDEIAHTHELLCELARMGKYYQVTSLQKLVFAHLSFQSFETTLMKQVLDNLLANGFELEDLCNLGCCHHLLRQLRMTPSGYFKRNLIDLQPASVALDMNYAFLLLSRRELRQEAGCVEIERMRGWPTRIIFGIGYSVDEMQGGGVSVNPRLLFNRRDEKSRAMIEVIAAGYPVKDLLADGFTSSVIQCRIRNSHAELRKHGYTNDDLRALGYAERLLARS